jgi:hypothetical protein
MLCFNFKKALLAVSVVAVLVVYLFTPQTSADDCWKQATPKDCSDFYGTWVDSFICEDNWECDTAHMCKAYGVGVAILSVGETAWGLDFPQVELVAPFQVGTNATTGTSPCFTQYPCTPPCVFDPEDDMFHCATDLDSPFDHDMPFGVLGNNLCIGGGIEF